MKQGDLDREANVQEVAISTLRSLAKPLSWPHYQQLLGSFLRRVQLSASPNRVRTSQNAWQSPLEASAHHSLPRHLCLLHVFSPRLDLEAALHVLAPAYPHPRVLSFFSSLFNFLPKKGVMPADSAVRRRCFEAASWSKTLGAVTAVHALDHQ